MRRGELSDTKWAKIEPLLPPEHSGKKGRPYVAHRKVLNGLIWRLRTGAPWRDIPERYGPYQTCYDRYVRFRRKGIWTQILQLIQAGKDAQGELDWATSCADGSNIRAHQHAAGAARSSLSGTENQATTSEAAPPEPTEPELVAQVQSAQALGYSRGGFGTKIHLVCDGKGRPLAATLSPGQSHESRYLAATLDAVRVPRVGRGRPKQRPT